MIYICVNINYYPLIKQSNGKKKILFKYGIKINNKQDFDKLQYYSNRYSKGFLPVVGEFEKFVNIPCGSCCECLRKKSRDLTLRLYEETKVHNNNWFITLSYNEEKNDKGIPNLPKNKKGVPTLRKKDISDFNKKLKVNLTRKNLFSQFKFFGCGEYGEKFHRPHYHIIYFDLPIPDLKFYKVKDGHVYYTSEYLNNIWKKGFIVISNSSLYDIAYVSQYVEKKQILNKSQKDYIRTFLDIEPEFQFGSKHLGINILDNIIEKLETNQYRYYVNGFSFSIPKYIRNYLPEELRNIILEEYSKKIGLSNMNRNKEIMNNIELDILNSFNQFYSDKKIRDLKFI